MYIKNNIIFLYTNHTTSSPLPVIHKYITVPDKAPYTIACTVKVTKTKEFPGWVGIKLRRY